MQVLRDLGYRPFLAEHALAETGYTAGTAGQRASDINGMFADPTVRAIFASHGGRSSQAVLDHLDWTVIAAAPTIFVGFSNITTLNLALHARTGLVTFNGNMVIWHLGMDPSPYDLEELQAVLGEGRTGPVRKNSEWQTVRGGKPGTGRLVGDALGLRGLAGTPYAWEPDEDLILFFEGMADPPDLTESLLHHLRQMGLFERTRGVLVGDDGAAFSGSPPEVPFTELLLRVAGDYDFPIVECGDFGHGCPNTVLPIGVEARLDPEPATLELLEAPVR